MWRAKRGRYYVGLRVVLLDVDDSMRSAAEWPESICGKRQARLQVATLWTHIYVLIGALARHTPVIECRRGICADRASDSDKVTVTNHFEAPNEDQRGAVHTTQPNRNQALALMQCNGHNLEYIGPLGHSSAKQKTQKYCSSRRPGRFATRLLKLSDRRIRRCAVISSEGQLN